ncbi:hypothetical protein [Thiofilum flexile]|uniref:hypothetical protein n=1 Tax=Thiofilum flexile TaxID=125627 RepID=UPI00037215F3|nr:hypothetical protein [Thiofilum flexile]
MKFGKSGVLGLLTLLLLIGLGIFFSKNYFRLFSDDPMIVITNQVGDTANMGRASPKLNEQGMLLEVLGSKDSGCPPDTVLNEQQLLNLPQQTFKTSHTWSKEPQTFSGPLLEDVLKYVCPDKKFIKLHLRALDGYAIDLNFPAVQKYRPIVALTVNGEGMKIRDKGHLWVMAPLDDFNIPERSLDELLIWQLNQISVNLTE